VHESGPTGYVLARFLREAGVDCVVAASSKLLRAPGDRIKTDKWDARLLAEMLALGRVTEVRVPTREQEDLRDLSRLRATAAKEQAELLAAHLKRIDQRVAAVAKDCEYTPVIDALMCLRGIQVTTGFGLAVEIGDWTRFTGATIGSYVGLVPSEPSSGQSRHQGPITRAGSKNARRLLIEAAWQHRRPYARPGLRMLRQLDLVGAATRALEGNHRLHHNWEVFDARKKRSVTANTAIARELAGWCWSLAAPLQQGDHGQGERMNAA
jgi:transposase